MYYMTSSHYSITKLVHNNFSKTTGTSDLPSGCKLNGMIWLVKLQGSSRVATFSFGLSPIIPA